MSTHDENNPNAKEVEATANAVAPAKKVSRKQRRAEQLLKTELDKRLTAMITTYFRERDECMRVAEGDMELARMLIGKEMQRLNALWRQWLNLRSKSFNYKVCAPMLLEAIVQKDNEITAQLKQSGNNLGNSESSSLPSAGEDQPKQMEAAREGDGQEGEATGLPEGAAKDDVGSGTVDVQGVG